jgi:hypothetical protein
VITEALFAYRKKVGNSAYLNRKGMDIDTEHK